MEGAQWVVLVVGEGRLGSAIRWIVQMEGTQWVVAGWTRESVRGLGAWGGSGSSVVDANRLGSLVR